MTTTFADLLDAFLKVNNQLTQIQKRPVAITPTVKVSTSALHLIDIVGRFPQANMTELAMKLGVTKGAISQQVRNLQQQGLLQAVNRADDQKTKRLVLTSQGRTLYHAHLALHRDLYAAVQDDLTDFTDEQLATLRTILEQISQSITTYQDELTEKSVQP
ncbi:MarR family winged helix-turn-helix transcriptional regulator [Schleiferilactobacillus shenzhenensis]|uniref:HTH marR-type domain-containing protein n=1 Tax=Schleiferilactobacillus shenzhenensis LY-73 TaxID=1231336 RepID=U4TX82_9LACO|nr:MarR family transcriptional regulator [Schleiferilactobacillus shenzhenensis]ERL65957.1 hypothetical protein L248_2033 [Schleiferilactobacillus shenzhenensis LY-73]